MKTAGKGHVFRVGRVAGSVVHEKYTAGCGDMSFLSRGAGSVRYLFSASLFVAVVVLASCATRVPDSESTSMETILAAQGEYRIGVDDRLQISVWKNPDLSATVPVRPDGMISMPLIGDVQAGGLPANQIAKNIRERLSAFIREPNVTVIVSELRSHEYISRIRITGAVRTPKSLPYRQGMTVLDAVLEAGGPNEFAATNRSKLYRKGKEGTEIYDVHLGDILTKGRLVSNFPLRPGDVVTVPERLF